MGSSLCPTMTRPQLEWPEHLRTGWNRWLESSLWASVLAVGYLHPFSPWGLRVACVSSLTAWWSQQSDSLHGSWPPLAWKQMLPTVLRLSPQPTQLCPTYSVVRMDHRAYSSSRRGKLGHDLHLLMGEVSWHTSAIGTYICGHLFETKVTPQHSGERMIFSINDAVK